MSWVNLHQTRVHKTSLHIDNSKSHNQYNLLTMEGLLYQRPELGFLLYVVALFWAGFALKYFFMGKPCLIIQQFPNLIQENGLYSRPFDIFKKPSNHIKMRINPKKFHKEIPGLNILRFSTILHNYAWKDIYDSKKSSKLRGNKVKMRDYFRILGL